jgi:hypothetical protein
MSQNETMNIALPDATKCGGILSMLSRFKTCAPRL